MPYNLLRDPIIDIEGDSQALSLPQLLAAWSGGSDIMPARVRAHQESLLQVFLVQIAVSALVRTGTQITHFAEWNAGHWHDALCHLAELPDWDLVATAPDCPAFLQPAVPADLFPSFEEVTHPDDLTIIVKARNHATKLAAFGLHRPWDWVLALLEQQTASGYSGRGQYKILRMNGGYGTRVVVASYAGREETEEDGAVYYAPPTLADRWRSDTLRLLTRTQEILDDDLEIAPTPLPGENIFASPTGGVVATWVLPWDDSTSLDPTRLEPLHVETARQIRLIERQGSIVACKKATKTVRTHQAKDQNGICGDPWTPIDVSKVSAFSPSESGWSLRRLVDLILNRQGLYQPAFLQTKCARRGMVYFYGAALVGGQGKTKGFHRILLPIPEAISEQIDAETISPELDHLVGEMLDDERVARNILSDAVVMFATNGKGLQQDDPKKRNEARQEITHVWQQRFQRALQQDFFLILSERFGGHMTDIRWRTWLAKQVRDIALQAFLSIPTRTGQQVRADAEAHRVLDSGVYNLIRHRTQFKPK